MKIECPHCKQKYEIDDQYQGESIFCPQCNIEFTAIPQKDFSPQSVKDSTVIRLGEKEKNIGVKIQCPKCLTGYNVEDREAKLQCGECGHVFTVVPTTFTTVCVHCKTINYIANYLNGKVANCINCNNDFLALPATNEILSTAKMPDKVLIRGHNNLRIPLTFGQILWLTFQFTLASIIVWTMPILIFLVILGGAR